MDPDVIVDWKRNAKSVVVGLFGSVTVSIGPTAVFEQLDSIGANPMMLKLKTNVRGVNDDSVQLVSVIPGIIETV